MLLTVETYVYIVCSLRFAKVCNALCLLALLLENLLKILTYQSGSWVAIISAKLCMQHWLYQQWKLETGQSPSLLHFNSLKLCDI